MCVLCPWVCCSGVCECMTALLGCVRCKAARRANVGWSFHSTSHASTVQHLLCVMELCHQYWLGLYNRCQSVQQWFMEHAWCISVYGMQPSAAASGGVHYLTW